MDGHKAGDLNCEYNRVDRFEVVAVKERGPENLKAAIEQGTTRTYHRQCLIIESTREAVLFERV